MFPLIVHGEKVRLRALSAKEWETIGQWVTDADVKRFLTHEGKIDFTDSRYLGIDAGQDDGAPLIGYLGLCDYDRRTESAELTICIGRKKFWNRGFGADAVCAFLRYLFYTTGLQSVYLRVLRDNKRAIHCYKKGGFQMRAVMRAGRRADRGWRDVILMECRRESLTSLRTRNLA